MLRLISCFFCFLLTFGLVDSASSTQTQGSTTTPTAISTPAADAQTKQKVLRAGWYPWDPYQYLMINDGITRLTGLDVELLKAIFEKMGYALNFSEVSWNQHQIDIEHGARDIAAGAFKSDVRSKYAYYSDSYRTEKDVIYVRENDTNRLNFKTTEQWFELLNNQNIRLGVVNGFYYGPTMMAFINDPENASRIVRVATDKENLTNLLNQNVDAISIDELVADTLIWRNKWQGQVKEVGVPIFSDGIHVIFSKAATSPTLVAEFNASLNNLRETGQYQEIVRTYLLPVMLHITSGQWWFVAVDIIGTIAFAMSGVLLARQGRYSFFGAVVLAALPSVGGGIIRDLLLQRDTLSVIKSPLYLFCILATVVAFYFIFRIKSRLTAKQTAGVDANADANLIGHLNNHSAVALFDAVGLAAFTVIGAIVAVDANVQPLWLWGPLFAALTGAGGGILRDVIRADVDNPGLKGSFYAEVALIWGLVFSLLLNWYSGFEQYYPEHITAMVIFVFLGALGTRMFVFHHKIRSPMF
jgi:polar amino acid transport system substrate-binding protein